MPIENEIRREGENWPRDNNSCSLAGVKRQKLCSIVGGKYAGPWHWLINKRFLWLHNLDSAVPLEAKLRGLSIHCLVHRRVKAYKCFMALSEFVQTEALVWSVTRLGGLGRMITGVNFRVILHPP